MVKMSEREEHSENGGLDGWTGMCLCCSVHVPVVMEHDDIGQLLVVLADMFVVNVECRSILHLLGLLYIVAGNSTQLRRHTLCWLLVGGETVR